MLQAFVFEKVGVVVGDLYFLDPNPHPGQEGPEHGVRLELRVIDRGELKSSIYSAVPIAVGKPIWRVDLLESVDGKPGSFNRTHHHPKFTEKWDPTSRVFLRELSQDPLGWLAGQLADLPGILDRAEVPQDVADPSDAASLKDMAPAIAGVAGMMLDKVRAGELGTAPGDDAVDSIRNGLALGVFSLPAAADGRQDRGDHHEGHRLVERRVQAGGEGRRRRPVQRSRTHEDRERELP